MTVLSAPSRPQVQDIAELLRQSLAGLWPADPLAHLLDRVEGR